MNNEKEGRELFECYNTRMKLHFGSAAEDEGMLMNFDDYKAEFKRYMSWHPTNRLVAKYERQNSEEFINAMQEKLLAKSKKERFGKFDFH